MLQNIHSTTPNIHLRLDHELSRNFSIARGRDTNYRYPHNSNNSSKVKQPALSLSLSLMHSKIIVKMENTLKTNNIIKQGPNTKPQHTVGATDHNIKQHIQ